MRISDDERREVAARLRKLPSDAYAAAKVWQKDGLFIDVNLSDEADYSQIHNAVFGCFPADHMHPGDYEELRERIADLIDRPTCFDTESKDSKSFTCSACGFSESKLVVNPFTLTFSCVKPSYRYCPKCGAMVVKKEEDE